MPKWQKAVNCGAESFMDNWIADCVSNSYDRYSSEFVDTYVLEGLGR